MNYAFAMSASPEQLLRTIEGVVVADDADDRGRRLAKNHGFLKGLMVRVGRHFRDAAGGAVRVLKSGGVWFALLSAIASAIMFMLDARQLRHFKMQPGLGKARILPVGLAFLSFIGSFVAFFKKAISAWRAEAEPGVEEKRAQELGTKFETAEGLLNQAVTQAKKAEASSMTPVAQALANAGISVNVVESGISDSLEGMLDRAKDWVKKNFSDPKKAIAFLRKNSEELVYASVFTTFVTVYVVLAIGVQNFQKQADAKLAKAVKTQLWRARALKSVPGEFTEAVNKALKVVG